MVVAILKKNLVWNAFFSTHIQIEFENAEIEVGIEEEGRRGALSAWHPCENGISDIPDYMRRTKKNQQIDSDCPWHAKKRS